MSTHRRRRPGSGRGRGRDAAEASIQFGAVACNAASLGQRLGEAISPPPFRAFEIKEVNVLALCPGYQPKRSMPSQMVLRKISDDDLIPSERRWKYSRECCSLIIST